LAQSVQAGFVEIGDFHPTGGHGKLHLESE
jgi:hypothetical protein